ncbi:MAG: hypothetical protein IJC86_04480 [Clostridia bacterium]|nr:hypothetical protein [Clostridia bacterium]
MEVKYQEVLDRAKSNTRRIDKLEERADKNDELIKSVAVLAEKQSEMESSLGEIKTDIKSIKDKPGKRWDSIVEKALLAVVTGLIGYIFIRLGIS